MMLSKRALKRLVFEAMPEHLKGRSLTGKQYIIMLHEDETQEKVMLNHLSVKDLSVKELYSLCKKLHARGHIEPTMPWHQI